MRGAFITDEHHPFSDEQARQIALKIVQDYKPEIMIVGSDGVDFYNVSHFDKNPERVKLGLQAELDQWKKSLREWKSAAKKAKFHFIAGNHEDRLRKYLYGHPELFGLEALELQNMLGLIENNIEWNEDTNEVSLNNRLIIKHGTMARKWAGTSAKAEVENERFQVSVLLGHCHRGGTFMTTTREGTVIGQEGFCLCDLNPEYVQRPDWQQGIVLFDVTDDYLNIEPIPINSFRSQKRAIWRGKEYG